MIHAKNDEPMDEQITDLLVSSSRCVFFLMFVFIVRVNTTFGMLCIQLSSTTCFGHFGHQVDFQTFMNKNAEVGASPSQLIH
jgi:hypothetical protein